MAACLWPTTFEIPSVGSGSVGLGEHRGIPSGWGTSGIPSGVPSRVPLDNSLGPSGGSLVGLVGRLVESWKSSEGLASCLSQPLRSRKGARSKTSQGLHDLVTLPFKTHNFDYQNQTFPQFSASVRKTLEGTPG